MEFRTVSTDSEWNDEAFQGVFWSLSEHLEDEVAAGDDPDSLHSLIFARH